jgi:CheY-like chemotaxis protein
MMNKLKHRTTNIAQNNKLNINVLIVEDQSTDIVGPYMLFYHLGLDATLAFDGEQALTELQNKHYDLIILDWNMPFVSGSEFLMRLENKNSKLELQRPLNIILHSGNDLKDIRFISSKNFHVIDVWKKPLTAVEIATRIKTICNKIKGAA